MAQDNKQPPFPHPTRRNLLGLSTAAMGGAGVCALAVPFLNSLRGPEASLNDAAMETSFLDVDLADLAPGTSKTVVWRQWPVFIQHRTPAMIEALKDPSLRERLRDPDSHIRQQPRDAVNFHRSIVPAYGVLVGICTHLGCIPTARDVPTKPPVNGYFCPCHGSQFDGAGRVLRDMPAPCNLPVPPMRFLGPTVIRLGESAGEPGFNMNDIQQL